MDAEPRRPSGLRTEEVSTLIEELNTFRSPPGLCGARLEKVYDRPPHGWMFRFRMQRESPPHSSSTDSKRAWLYLTTRPATTRFHLVDDPGASPASPSVVTAELRSLLGGARLERIDQPGADRIVRFRFARGPQSNPRIAYDLIFELFGRSGRILLVDPESKVVRFYHGRGGIAVGERYRFPEPLARRKKSETLTMPFDPGAHIDDEFRLHATPFHAFLASRMHREEARLDREERRRGFLIQLRRERKKCRELSAKLEREEEEAGGWEEFQLRGELLKSSLQQLKRGLDKVEVTNWFDPETPLISIDLDRVKSPTENVERYFRRARKGKRALPVLAERLRTLHEDLGTIGQFIEETESMEDGSIDFDRSQLELAEAWLKEHGRVRKGASGRKSRQQRRRDSKEGATSRKSGSPVRGRHFRTREGLDVFAGRNARENDELSIRFARGNDLFFHRAGKAGPHVILRVPKGKNASPESIDDAAFLAAYLAGWRGPGDERVLWTEAKHVRKPKGLPPGKVLTERTREHRVRYDSQRVGRLSVARSEEEPNG